MSIVIEDQALPTLKEWAKLLGIKGTSTFRKPQMIELMNKVGAERIEKALRLAGVDPDAAADTENAAGEEAAEKPAEVPAPAPAAEPMIGGRPRSRWTSISKNFSKPEAASAGAEAAEIKARTLAKPINDAPDDNSEISEPEEGTAAKPRRIGEGANPAFDRSNHYTGRGGFGTYSASYLAQTEKPDEFEKSEQPNRPVRPERVREASAGRTFSLTISRQQETVPAEEQTPPAPRFARRSETKDDAAPFFAPRRDNRRTFRGRSDIPLRFPADPGDTAR